MYALSAAITSYHFHIFPPGLDTSAYVSEVDVDVHICFDLTDPDNANMEFLDIRHCFHLFVQCSAGVGATNILKTQLHRVLRVDLGKGRGVVLNWGVTLDDSVVLIPVRNSPNVRWIVAIVNKTKTSLYDSYTP